MEIYLDNRRMITKNKTIMDFSHEFVLMNENPEKVHKQINQVSLWKKLYLPVEIIGPRGRSRTDCLTCENKKSPLEW